MSIVAMEGNQGWNILFASLKQLLAAIFIILLPLYSRMQNSIYLETLSISNITFF